VDMKLPISSIAFIHTALKIYFPHGLVFTGLAHQYGSRKDGPSHVQIMVIANLYLGAPHNLAVQYG
jgi:hypothetical protein